MASGSTKYFLAFAAELLRLCCLRVRGDPKTMHHNCQECIRLWNEYALATRHYLKIEGKLQIADISHDENTVSQLRPMLLEAAAERTELRRLIEQHESYERVGAARA